MTGKKLPIADVSKPGDARRHPDDGYPIADPYPVDAKTERAVRSLMRVLLPERDAPRSADLDERVYHQMLIGLMYMPSQSAKGILAVFRMLEWAPVWRLKGRKPLSELPRDEASAILSEIASSPLLPVRLLMLAPKALIFSAYFDQDEVHRALDYDPISFTRERIALRQRILAGETPTEADAIRHAKELR
jgi:hypothetical protein